MPGEPVAWHPEPRWLLRAYDEDKQAERDFAVRDCTFAPEPGEPVVCHETLEMHHNEPCDTQDNRKSGELERLRAECERLREALQMIADGRGVCRTCGKPAEGPGTGYVSCDVEGKRCSWGEADAQDIARAALAEGGHDE